MLVFQELSVSYRRVGARRGAATLGSKIITIASGRPDLTSAHTACSSSYLEKP